MGQIGVILKFRKKNDKMVCYKDNKFYVASKDLHILPNANYSCKGLKKFRSNPKGRARSGFVVTEAELIPSEWDIQNNKGKIFIFRDGEKMSEIHINKMPRNKINFLCEIEKCHKNEKKASHTIAKFFKMYPEDIHFFYDELRYIINNAKKENNRIPYFRKRLWNQDKSA